jgi:hypothetical protein
MWITSYWAHPAGLALLGTARVAWMAASPAALALLVTGVAQLLRRVELSPRGFRYTTRVGHVAWAGMAALLVGSLTWLLSGGTGMRPVFHAGAIDQAALAALALALAAAVIAGRRARLSGRAVAGVGRLPGPGAGGR